MSRQREPISLFDVIRRAVDVADPDRADARLGDLLEAFEDDDEPVSGVDQLDEVLAESELDLDVDGDDPGIALAIALARYLAHHLREMGADDDRLLTEAVRWQWHGHAPAGVTDLLSERGVTI
jgi:hypothetical protein